jgi:uncharacterized protein YukE
MAQLNVDPQKVDELIKRLNKHTQDTIYQQKQLKGFLQTLEQSWNDGHYKSFNEQFIEFDHAIQRAMQLSETVLLPQLKNVKKYAEDYKNMGRK